MGAHVLGDIDIYRHGTIEFVMNSEVYVAYIEAITCYDNSWTMTLTWTDAGETRMRTGVGKTFEDALINAFEDEGLLVYKP
jgi:hypothetical protein